MALIEVDINGTKTYVNNELDVNQTGVAITNDLEQTNVNDDTMIDIYGEGNE